MPDPSRWVPVASCANLSEAQANAAVLEAEGIETRIEDHDRSGISRFATWMVAFPQIVLVREPDEERAREALGTASVPDEAALEAEALAATAAPDPAAADTEASTAAKEASRSPVSLRFVVIVALALAALLLFS